MTTHQRLNVSDEPTPPRCLTISCFALLPALILTACDVCKPGASQECYCATTATSTQTCADDGSRWTECRCGTADGDGDSDADSDGDSDADARDDADPDGPCRTDEQCADGVFCNGAEQCAEGVCLPGEPPDCDDGEFCTVDQCSAETDSCLNQVTTEWYQMESGTRTWLYSVWGSAADDVFAVGRSSSGSIILHYDGTSWQRMRIPSPDDTNNSTGLNDVWGSGPDDVFASGGLLLLHYDGTSWSQMEAESSSTAIWGFAPDDVYASARVPIPPYTVRSPAYQRYDGSEWEVVSRLADCFEYCAGVVEIWGSGPNDLWFLLHASIRRFDGVSWSWLTPDEDWHDDFRGIWGSSSNDVFVLEYNEAYHHDGMEWEIMETPAEYGLDGIFGTSATNVYAVGGNNTIVHYNGESWTMLHTEEENYKWLHDVWVSDEDDVFAVGTQGTILYRCGSET